MVFSFARVGATPGMRVDYVFVQSRRLWVRPREKGGDRHEMPCHHTLEAYLHAYLDGTGIADDAKGPFFRTIARGTGRLTRGPCPRQTPTPWFSDARSPPASIPNRQSQLPGDRDHRRPEERGTLANAAAMAKHASTRTTQLYDRRRDDITLDEVERMRV